MKAIPRTYERGYEEGFAKAVSTTLDLLLSIFHVVLKDKTNITDKEYQSVVDSVNLYAEQINAGELTLEMIEEVAQELTEK